MNYFIQLALAFEGKPKWKCPLIFEGCSCKKPGAAFLPFNEGRYKICAVQYLIFIIKNATIPMP